MIEYDRLWTFTSTGAGAWEDSYLASNHTFNLETAAGSTASIRIETRRKDSSIGVLLSTAVIVMDASSAVTLSIVGALYQVRPYVTAKTSTGTVYVQGFGVT